VNIVHDTSRSYGNVLNHVMSWSIVLRLSPPLLRTDQAKEKPTEGEVIDAGPGRLHPETAVLMKMCVNPGEPRRMVVW